MHHIWKFALLTLSLGLTFPAHGAGYDIVIKNGLVVDGTRNIGQYATVAIRDGKITKKMLGRFIPHNDNSGEIK